MSSTFFALVLKALRSPWRSFDLVSPADTRIIHVLSRAEGPVTSAGSVRSLSKARPESYRRVEGAPRSSVRTPHREAMTG